MGFFDFIGDAVDAVGGAIGDVVGSIPIVGDITGFAGQKEGKQQIKQGNAMYEAAKGMQRGAYDIQPQFVDNYNRAGLQSLSGIPAAQRAFMMQNIMRSGANALGAGNLTRNSSSLIGRIQQQQNDAYNQLGAQDAQQRLANQGALMNAAGVLGQQGVNKQGYESMLSEKDRDRELGRSEQLIAAGNQNKAAGRAQLGNLAGSALSYITGGGDSDGGGGGMSGAAPYRNGTYDYGNYNYGDLRNGKY